MVPQDDDLPVIEPNPDSERSGENPPRESSHRAPAAHRPAGWGDSSGFDEAAPSEAGVGLGFEDVRGLFEGALEELETVVGRYEISEKLGEGGEANVYLAYARSVERLPVALKVLKPEHRSNREMVRHFRRAAERLARLDHPSIISVRELGHHKDNPPYVALQYASGGSLADHSENFRNPLEAAELVLKVARAIQHAHERGVLHGDISPSNVLLEGKKPLVTDFVANRIGQLRGGIEGGKCKYMPPEKAKGHGDTAATDTFGMGAVLYEMLQGSPPTSASTIEEVRTAYDKPPPRIVSFRGLKGVAHEHLLPELDAFCRTALHPNPNGRYRSAQAFVENLDRVLRGLPTYQPFVPFTGRARMWLSRSPWMGVLLTLGIAAVLIADLYIARSANNGAEIQASSILEYNKHSAHLQAQAMLEVFRKFEVSLYEAGQEPAFISYLEDPFGPPPQAVLREQLLRSRLDGIALFDLSGTLLGRYPDPGAGIIGRDFSFRDYHTCMMKLLEAADLRGFKGLCVTPVYHGESSKTMEISFAAPILDEDGEVPIGYQIQSYHARRTLDVEESKNRQTGLAGQTTALFGHRGIDRADTKRDKEAVNAKLSRMAAAAHPALFGTAEFAMDAELSGRIIKAFEVGQPGAQLDGLDAEPLTEEHYVDPVTGIDSLAAIVPVGATGYVVVASTPRETALASWQRHSDLLILSLGLLNAGLLALGVIIVVLVTRSSRPVEDPS